MKDEHGKVIKVATHKLPAIPNNIPDNATEAERKQVMLDTAYEYVERLVLHNGIAYNTAKKPCRLLQAANNGKEPGEFLSYPYSIKRTPDFHVDMDIDGRKHWKPLQEQELSIQREKGDI